MLGDEKEVIGDTGAWRSAEMTGVITADGEVVLGNRGWLFTTGGDLVDHYKALLAREGVSWKKYFNVYSVRVTDEKVLVRPVCGAVRHG